MRQERSNTMVQRLSVNLSDDVANALREIADEDGISVTEAIRRAISSERWIRDVDKRKGKILVQEPGSKNVQEAVFLR